MSGDTAPRDPARWSRHVERSLALAGDAGRTLETARDPARDVGPALRRVAQGMAAMYDAIDGRKERATSLAVAHGRLLDAAIGVALAGLPDAVKVLRDACAELLAAEEGIGDTAQSTGSDASPPPLRASVDVPRVHTVARASLMPVFRAPPFRGAKQAARLTTAVDGGPTRVEGSGAGTLPEPAATPPGTAAAPPGTAPATTFKELSNTARVLQAAAEERRGALMERLKKPARPASRKDARSPRAEAPPPGFARAPEPALSEDEFARRWARECFEDIGMLGVQRAPLPGDDWRSCRTLEARMLHAIDAIAALGAAAVGHVERLAVDAPAPDPMRVFAAAMIGGSVAGRDALGVAERVLLRYGASDPVVAGAFGAAMRLAPHPMLPDVLRGLARSKERGCRPLAVSVLADRGWLTAAEMAEMADDGDPAVLASVLVAMGAAHHPDLERAANAALGHADRAVRTAAIDALTIAGHAGAVEAAREAALGARDVRQSIPRDVRQSFPHEDGALVRLAIVAGEEEALQIVERLRSERSVSAIEAAGWAGHVSAVPLLIEALEGGGEEVKRAAGAALDRLLGAGLVDEIEISPEALEEPAVIDPDPDPKAPRRSLAEIVDDARDPTPKGSTETLAVPSVSPARWRDFWAENAGRFDVRRRWRRGQTHCPEVILHELDRLPLDMDDRRTLQRELAFRTGRWVRLDPHDLVATQEKSLAAWAEVVARADPSPAASARETGW